MIDRKEICNIWFKYFDDDAILVFENPGFKVWTVPNSSQLKLSYAQLFGEHYVRICDRYWNEFNQKFSTSSITISSIEQYADSIGFKWNPTDLIYYKLSDGNTTSNYSMTFDVRQLTVLDQESFDEMSNFCSDEDLDAGFVELHHPLVVGAFHQGQMISRASAYPFLESDLIADIGYISIPKVRGKGAASACVDLLCSKLRCLGRVPQIRVQPQLTGSVKVAERAGFELAGIWKYDFQE